MQLWGSHNKLNTWFERSQVLIRLAACSVGKKKMLWKALQFRGTTWKMGSDSMSSYSNKCIKISLKPCQSTYHLSLWPSICLPIHFSAQVGCLFSPSHQRCIEIQSLALNQWVWGELPEQIRVGGSWRELSSDRSSFPGLCLFSPHFS